MRTKHTLLMAGFLVVVYLLLVPPNSQAQSSNDPSPLNLSDEQGEYLLGFHMAYLEDPTGSLTIEQVSNSPYLDQFTPAQSHPLNLGLTQSTYWLRFQVDNQTTLPTQWLLEMQFPSLHAISLFRPNPQQDGYTEIETGYVQPFTSREVPHHNFVFNLNTSTETIQTYYLRVKNAQMTLQPVVWSATAFSVKNQHEYIWLGLYFGSLLIMAVFNLFLFLTLRDRVYLLYVLLIAGLGLFRAALLGLTNQYLWPEAVRVNYFIIPFVGALNTLLVLRFAQIFLVTKTKAPRFHGLFNGLMGVQVALALGAIAWGAAALIVGIWQLTTAVSYVLAWSVGLRVWRRGYLPARYYMLAWTVFLLGGAFNIAVSFGLAPDSLILVQNQVTMLGVLLLITLLSFALADRINILKQEKEQAQAAALVAAQETEELIQKQNIVLEETIAARTQQLAQANTQLQLQVQELDAYAHTVAHDLKSPLGILLGYAELLSLEPDSLAADTVQEILDAVSRSAHKANEIVEELLLLATVRQQKQIPVHPLEMGAVVKNAQTRLRATTQNSESSVEIRLEKPETWPVCLGYTPWIEEVWINYLSNALKYGDNPAQISVGGDIQGQMGRFWVQDRGAGLTPEEQNKLFVPFERLQQTRAQGHGLGLSIVRRIVETLNGRVGVESEVGEGSMFYFTLPLATASERT